MTRENRLIRVDNELHRAAKVTSAFLGSNIARLARESAAEWLSEGRPFYEGISGNKQILVPTDEDLDRKMRVAAAYERDGLPVNQAYGSALLYGVKINIDGLIDSGMDSGGEIVCFLRNVTER